MQLVNDEKKKPYHTTVSTILFNERATVVHDCVPVDCINRLEYRATGGTALFDCLGEHLNKIRRRHVSNPDKAPKNTLVAIMTDGEDNASRYYTSGQIKSLVTELQKLGWKFIFLGANINAKDTAAKLGIAASNAADYADNAKGTLLNFAAIAGVLNGIREKGAVPEEWAAAIERHNRACRPELGSGSNDEPGSHPRRLLGR